MYEEPKLENSTKKLVSAMCIGWKKGETRTSY